MGSMHFGVLIGIFIGTMTVAFAVAFCMTDNSVEDEWLNKHKRRGNQTDVMRHIEEQLMAEKAAKAEQDPNAKPKAP